MKIELKTIHFSLLESQRNLFYQKLKLLDKFTKHYGSEASLLILIEKETSHHQSGDLFIAKAEIKIKGKNPLLKVKSESIEQLAEELKDGLERLIIENKETYLSKFKKNARNFKKFLQNFVIKNK